MIVLLVLVILYPSKAAFGDSYTNCYGNCNTCQLTDFTNCTSSSASCNQGYFYNGTTCVLMPAMNSYTMEFLKTNTKETPVGWIIQGGGAVNTTITCNTTKNGQIFDLVGPFFKQTVSKTLSVAKNMVLIVNIYILRVDWTQKDQLQISIQSGNNTVLKTEIIKAGSHLGDESKNYNFLKWCDDIPGTKLVGRQISLVIANGTNAGNITLLFQPKLSMDARWAFSNLRILSGCNNFMISSLGNHCDECQPGYYYEKSKAECMPCHTTCDTCQNGTPQGCLSCPAFSTSIGMSCKYTSNFNIKQDSDVDTGKSNSTSSCQSTNMLGGPKYGIVNVPLKRIYTLPRHSYLKVRFRMMRVSTWPLNYTLRVTLDNNSILNISDFNEPIVSPYCLAQLGPVLCTTVRYDSGYSDHISQSATVAFELVGPANTSIRFGIYNIQIVYFRCPKQCFSCQLAADIGQICTTCNSFLTINSNCLECPNGFYKYTNDTSTTCRRCHVLCKNCVGQTSNNCTECFQNFRLVSGYCSADSLQGFVVWLQDLTKYNWVDSNFQSNSTNAGSFTCSQHQLYGVLSTSKPITMRRKYTLPDHRGMIILLNVFKLGVWTDTFSNITLLLDSEVFANVAVNSSAGSILCTNSSKDFIYTFYKYFIGHTKKEVELSIVAGGSVGIKSIVIVLKDCDECSNLLSFSVENIPEYTKDNSRVGINTWVKFNKPLQHPQLIAEDFSIVLNGKQLAITKSQYLHDLYLYTPLDFGFVNGSQVVFAQNPDKVLTTPQNSHIRLLAPIGQSLSQVAATSQLPRYDLLSQDNLDSIQQLNGVARALTGIALYGSIFSIGLGLGIAFEQYTINLQLIFMHTYIITNQLPASLKLMLNGFSSIEHLNYFSKPSRQRIERDILPKNHHQDSPHVFQQYYTDITFIRAIYPILILNLVYTAYFGILLLVFHFCKPLKQSKFVVVKWFRQMVGRPLNFADSLMRLQFVTVIWAATVQFHHINSSDTHLGFSRFNTFLTILMFGCACIYPVFMVVYLYKVKSILLKESFGYMYEDIFFKRIRKNQDELDSFMYLIIKFLRLFFYAFFGALLVYQQIAAPVAMLVATLLENGFLISKEIYMDKLLLTFKVLDFALFMSVEICYIVIWASSNKWSTQDFLNIGYITSAIIIVLVVVSIFRTVYLVYLKINAFLNRNKKPLVNSSARIAIQNTERSQMAMPKTQYLVPNETIRSIMPIQPTEENIQV